MGVAATIMSLAIFGCPNVIVKKGERRRELLSLVCCWDLQKQIDVEFGFFSKLIISYKKQRMGWSHSCSLTRLSYKLEDRSGIKRFFKIAIN